jgi:hypothetical protein
VRCGNPRRDCRHVTMSANVITAHALNGGCKFGANRDGSSVAFLTVSGAQGAKANSEL